MPKSSLPSATGGLRGVPLAGALFCVCYLAWQATFAVSCFGYGYGCNLTWTMYSSNLRRANIFVEWKSGEESLLDEDQGIDGVGRVLGGKVDRARYVPPYLCEHIPDIQAVRVEFLYADRVVRHTCTP